MLQQWCITFYVAVQSVNQHIEGVKGITNCETININCQNNVDS